MTIVQLLSILWKRLWLIILATAVAGVIAGIFSWGILDNVYQASTTIIVSSQNATSTAGEQLTYNDYNLNIKLVNSYSVICKTNRVLDQVISELSLPITNTALSNKITVSSAKETEIIHIAVKDKDPYLAQKIANSLTRVFQEEVKEIMQMDNVQIIDDAPLPIRPVEPQRLRNLALGIVMGLMLGVGLAILLEYLDRSIKTEEQITDLIGIPVLVSVPRITLEEK
jgi:capsular polysaccharide biosynthesis protein